MVVYLLWFVFIVCALFLILLILIQEGKGGGLAEAFGGQGAETFGVKATGVNKVTAGLAAALFISAILINKCSLQSSSIKFNAPSGGESSSDAGGGAGGPNGAPVNGGGTGGTTTPADKKQGG